MKTRIFCVLLALWMMLSVVACARRDPDEGGIETKPMQSESDSIDQTEEETLTSEKESESEQTETGESEETETEDGTDTEAESSDETDRASDSETDSETAEESESETETESESDNETDSTSESQTVSETTASTDTSGGSTPGYKSIDLYLIAGQSNAVGHSKVTDAMAIYRRAYGLKNGYSNVLYAGNARSSSGTTLTNHEFTWTKTRLGLGKAGGDTLYMGPEAGMAAALNGHYNETSGKTAGIIKMAHGGTSLFNVKTNMCQFGNWVPPSYAQELGVTYEDGDVTGGLYRALLAQVEKHVDALMEDGYTHVRICGLYWMQGEMDTSTNEDTLTEYKKAFSYLVSDLRRDLSALMQELNGTEDDGGASRMPVIVGTISLTCGAADPAHVAESQAFVNMQKSLPTLVENCYVIDNSNYAINVWNESTQSVQVVGSDQFHWNQNDALEIGMSVGRLILNEELYSSDVPEGDGDDTDDTTSTDTTDTADTAEHSTDSEFGEIGVRDSDDEKGAEFGGLNTDMIIIP